jgi:transposase-like protein
MDVLTDLKNRGVADVFFIDCDGLKGLADRVPAVFPAAIVQACIIHLIRGTFHLVRQRLALQRRRNRSHQRPHRTSPPRGSSGRAELRRTGRG